jgi:AcrR family transcriptional regulator
VARRGLDAAQVLEEAVALADADGLQAVTFARLAARLGVRPPSLYNHVDGRAALLRLITLRGLEELTDAIAAAAAGLAGADALRACGHAYRRYAGEHPGCYEATLAPSGRQDAELLAASARLLEMLTAIMRGWQLDGEQAIDAIRAVRSALHGFVSLERSGGFAMARARDASFDALLEILVAGLAAGATAAGTAASTA